MSPSDNDSRKPVAASPKTTSQAPATPGAAVHAALGSPVVGDSDSDTPYLGSTLNAFTDNVSVNNMTGEVSVQVPLVNRPSQQGLDPDLAFGLAYNSTSPGQNSQIVSPYLQFLSPYFWYNSSKVWVAASLEIDWDLDLPAIIVTDVSSTVYTLRFQGQSYQANTNSDDSSSSKTDFYYAKDLENANKLQLSYTSGSNIKNGVTVITPDGTRYSINTKTPQGHYLLTSITKANGNSLSFNYVAPAYSTSALAITSGSLTVQDNQGAQVASLVAAYTGGSGYDYIPCLYVNYSNPASAAGSSTYDLFAQMSLNQGIVSFSSSGSALTSSTPYQYAYINVIVGSTKYYKLSTVTYPTGAYTQFNWLKGGFVVKYGVVHVTQAGDSDIDHTFQYSFAPVDTQAYYDYLGNQLWSKQYYYSEDQANNVTSGGDNNGATFQCPNMHSFDTNEMADGVEPTNNWLDPLFHSSDHMHDGTDVKTGEGYESGNVSQLINVQTFSVYEITTYPDGAATKTVNTYDALQRLQSTIVSSGFCGAGFWTLAITTYQYPVNVNQLGKGPDGDLTYHNYGLLPPNFNKPIIVQTTSYPLFNGDPISGTTQTTTTVNQYDPQGNLIYSVGDSGIGKVYTYYQGILPCGINPYITSICTTHSTLPSVGILGPLSVAQFVTPGSSPLAICNNTSYTSYTTMFGGGVILPDTQTTVLNGTINGPVTRTHTYDSLGRVSSVTESGDFGICTQTMSYNLDGQGNQTITTATRYGGGATGPTLPTTEVIDCLGRTLSSTDNLGRTTLYQYDSLSRITRQTEMANLPPDQQWVTAYAYEIIVGNAPTVGGTRTTVTTPNGAQVIYTFDCVGRQTSNQIKPVDGPQRFVRTFSYDRKTRDGGPCGNQMTASTTYIADGSSITVDYYYNVLGDLIATIPPSGSPGLAQATLNLASGNYAYALTFNFTYDQAAVGTTDCPITPYGLASLVQKDAFTGATANIYNFDSQALQLGNVSGNSVNAVLSSMNFSAYLLNADLSVNTAALMTAANSATTTAYTYDTLFRLGGETLTGAGKTLTTTRSYDRNGRLAQMQDPKGNVFTLASDAMGNPTQLSVTTPAGGNYYLATASHNAAGQKTSFSNTPSTTANVNPITYTYDPTTGMPLTETDALGNTIHYLFYPTGLLAVAWSQVETGYYLWTVVQYDQFGSVLSQWNGPIGTQPSLTNLTPSLADAIYSYTYNTDGQVATKTVQYANQLPSTTTYAYDGFGNMNTYTDPFGQTISASLDPYGRQSSMQATVNGKLLHQLQFAYDSLGRLSSLVKTSHQTCKNPQGVTESFQIQSNRAYSYDHLLRTVGVTDQTATPNLNNDGLTNFAQNLSYDVWGNVTSSTLQFVNQNGSVLGELDQGYTYDPYDRLTAYNVSPSDASFLPGDAKGHKIVAQTFAYDGLDNLQSLMTAYLDGTSATAPVTTETVNYGYSAGLPFQLESVTGYAAMAYDTLGRTTTDAYGNSLVYDVAGYVSTITQSNGQVISYSYGPDRAPYKQSSSDGTDLYTYLTDNNVTARTDDTGNYIVKTLIGFGGPTQFTTLDLLGNPVLTKSYQAQYPNYNALDPIVQESVSLQSVYSPTGIQTNLKGANPTAGYPQNLQPTTGKGSPLSLGNLTGGGLGLNNEITDPLTGYQILGGYRAYDPNLGRFNQPDSFAPGIAGLNPYAYTGNHFVGCSDPTGHYTYTYKSYGVAKRAIKRRAEEEAHQGFWQQVANSYKSVLVNLIKHPTNPSSYVAAAMLAENPTAPIMAAVVSQLGQASPVGAVIAGAYTGVQTAVDGVCTMGVVSYNPQTGLGSLNTAGAGNMLGMMSLGYLNMSPNGVVQVHAGHSFLTHLKHEGYGAADMLENIIGGIAGVGIGLCYDMPMDFAKGEYYQAGFALGMNTAMLVSMVAAPEDAPAEAGVGDAEAGTASAEEAAAATKARTNAKELENLPHGTKAFTDKFVSSATNNFKLTKAGESYGKAVDRTFSGKWGSKAVRMCKAGRFTDYAAEFLGGKIGGGISNLGTYSNLNMTDPRSPWSTAAWQNQLYRQGPYTPDKN